MTQTSLPKFSELTKVLSDTSLKLHPSQVHGLICGILCSDTPASGWEELVMGGQKTEKAAEVLHVLYVETAKLLKEFSFDFQLLLPADSKALPIRAEALTLWCQGMLTGLKLAQIAIVDRAPGEVTEAINDLIEIAKMNYEDVIASEEDEAAYIELVEYVRMASILIYQDLQEGATGKKTIKSNHLH